MPSEYCLLQKAAYFCPSQTEVARWTPFGHQMVQCRGQGKIISAVPIICLTLCKEKKGNVKYDSHCQETYNLLVSYIIL